MALITISASTPAGVPQAQIFAPMVWREARVQMAWKNFMGEGPNNVIVVEKRFTKEKGDGYTYSVFPDATQKGRAGSALESGAATLEGQEEAITPVSDTVLMDQLRFAERTAGKLTEQRAAFELRPNMKDNLIYQWARQCDELIFKKLSGVTYTDQGSNTFGEAAVANTSVLYGGGKNASADLTPGDTFTPNLVSRAKTLAKVGIRTDATASWRIRPFIVNGKPYYGCWIHPFQALSMKNSDEWKQAQREAAMRGPENPIFSGASGIWDGIVFYEHDKVVTGSDAGDGTVNYADALFFGLNAGVWCEAQEYPDWVEKTFDYGNQWGIASSMIFGFDKTMFTHPTPSAARDFGVIRIRTAAKAPEN